MADEQAQAVGMNEAPAPAQVDARAESEASQDAILARILDEAEGKTSEPSADVVVGEETDKPGRERGADGKFAKKPDATAGNDEPESKDTSEPDVAPPDTVNPDDYRKALTALQRAKAPQAILDTMNPEQLTSWGMSLSEEQAKQDGFGKQLAELKSKVGDDDTPAVPSIDLNLDEAVAPFVEYFGEDVAEPLSKFGQGLVAQFQQQLAPLTEAIRGQERDTARAKLEKQYSLDKDDRWQQVLDQRTQDVNHYASEHEAVAAACRNCFADEIIADYQAKLKDQHRKRENGQTTPSTRTTTPAAASKDDMEDDLLNAIQDGKTDEVIKLSRRFPKSGSHEVLLSNARVGG